MASGETSTSAFKTRMNSDEDFVTAKLMALENPMLSGGRISLTDGNSEARVGETQSMRELSTTWISMHADARCSMRLRRQLKSRFSVS